MRVLFTLSYGLLWAVVVLESVLLSQVLVGALRFKRRYAPFQADCRSERRNRLPKGNPAPEFAAPLLWTGKTLRTADLKGHASILLFVSADDTSLPYRNLSFAIHAWWHDTKGQLYLVCNGSEDTCRQLGRNHRVEGFAEDTVPIIVDEGDRIARSFLIDSTPQAVSLDEEARVSRYGYPSVGKKASGGVIDIETPPPELSKGAITSRSHLRADRTNDNGIISEMKQPVDGKKEACDWPDDKPYTGAAFARTETKASCVLTRFRLRSAWSLVPFYFSFRRVRRAAQDVSGLLQAVFLIEDLHTCYTMSLWKDDCAIVDFSTRVSAHIIAANSAFGPTYRSDLRRAEIWSAQFRLWAVSRHNLKWEGLDLQSVLGDKSDPPKTLDERGSVEQEYAK
jgi:hypothetical protein